MVVSMPKGFVLFRRICEYSDYYQFQGYTLEAEFGFGSGSTIADLEIDLRDVDFSRVDSGPANWYEIEGSDFTIKVNLSRRTVKLTRNGQSSGLQEAELNEDD